MSTRKWFINGGGSKAGMIAALGMILAVVGCRKGTTDGPRPIDEPDEPEEPKSVAVESTLEPKGAPLTDAGEPKPRVVEMVVTEKGFEPNRITVKRGEPVTLVVTRKTDSTCGREILIDDTDINAKLPLGKPVEVTFTPSRTGTLQYGCAMNKMVGGVILVQ